ncbi:hypothetical protein [Rhizobium leguminosarum]|uniref:hypothetical protein n=1 Tax=Rhizobium leguminosarum TaxID=384 RepID=UPI00041D1A22|nr:hypothetical protein [Rhizobium leguminosarum]
MAFRSNPRSCRTSSITYAAFKVALRKRPQALALQFPSGTEFAFRARHPGRLDEAFEGGFTVLTSFVRSVSMPSASSAFVAGASLSW